MQKKDRKKLNEYKKRVKPLIIDLLEKHFSNKKKSSTEEDALIQKIFLKKELKIYKEIQQASTIFGKVWEIALFNWEDWTRISKADGKSDSKKAYIELKNKPSTWNSSSKKTIIKTLRNFANKHPGFQVIVGFINDSKNTNKTLEEENQPTIYLYGSTTLFEYVFGEHHHEIKTFVSKVVIDFFKKARRK